jgi:imidazolonepropionase-like amidohydrolase
VFEAAKAYRNSLPYHVALAGVTSAPAELLGLGSRIGKVKAGFDADVVLWDSDPLSVGATPIQVFIDGTPQFKDPVELQKPFTSPLKTSVYEISDMKSTETTDVVFTGVSTVQLPGFEDMMELDGKTGQVVVTNGEIVCMGTCEHLVSDASNVVALSNGYISPPLTAFGSLLGLEEIAAEGDTSDGSLGQDSFSAAVDGLRFDGKNLDAAISHGVTKSITAPKFGSSGHKGISAGIRNGAKHALEKHAVFDPAVALHYTLTSSAKQGKTPTISSAIADLKSKLLGAIPTTKKQEEKSPEDVALAQVVNGSLPLVIDVHSADTIASLLRLKNEVSRAISASNSSANLCLVLFGGAESWIVAEELRQADVSVILTPLFSYSTSWDERRALTGAPLTNGTAVDALHAAGVKVAIGVGEDWEARDLFLQAGIVHTNSGGKISEKEALAMASSSIYDILGLKVNKDEVRKEFVVFEGNPLTIGGQLRAVADGSGGVRFWS